MAKKAIFDKKNVLVLGGAGFIGSHLCDELIKEAKVICIDNFSTGDEKNIDHLLSYPDFEFIKYDISEPIDLEKLPELQKFKIQFQGIQEIYNLACPNSPINFTHNIINTLHANSLAIKNVLDLAMKYEAKLLHFSSSVIYGPRKNLDSRAREIDLGVVDHLSDRSCYDEGKRFSETMIKNYRDIHKVDAKIIRLFRTYGPRMRLNDGNIVPDFINNAFDGKDLEILGDENFVSSFCYVKDAVDAAMKVMETDVMGPFNIGSDIDVNLTDLAKKILELTKSNSRIKYIESHFFVTPLALPDISKARDELAWFPVETLNKGLEETIHDLRASKGLRTASEFK